MSKPKAPVTPAVEAIAPSIPISRDLDSAVKSPARMDDSDTRTYVLAPGEASFSGSGDRRQSNFIEAGQILAERFKVTRFLGSGGMGEVFEADDRMLGDHVALKVFRGHGRASEEEMRRLRREVQLARRVTHRNVCRIFDLIQHRDPRTGMIMDLISMELLRGETLQDMILRRRRLRQEMALPIVRQVARGLNAAHSLGIVHRDLKPANIMLVEESSGLRAVVTDFGLAHSVDAEGNLETSSGSNGRVIGTPAYMAPEQVTRETTSAATDIYTLGIVIYEMLTGRLPFSGESPWLLAVNRVTGRPTPIRDLRPGLDPVLVEAVETCLRRDPAERYASVSEILEVLDRGDVGWNIYGTKTSDRDHVSPRGSSQSTASQDSVAPMTVASAGSELATTADLPSRGDSASSEAVLSSQLQSGGLLDSESSSADASEAKDRDSSEQPVAMLSDQGASSYPWLRSRLWPAATVITAILAMFIGQPWRAKDGEELSALSVDQRPLGIEAILAGYPEIEAAAGGSLSPEDAANRAQVLGRAEELLGSYRGEQAAEVLLEGLVTHGRDPILLTRLAEAYWRAGREEQARSAIEEAFGMASSLSAQEQQSIEAFYRGFRGEWKHSQELFESLWLSESDFSSGLWALEAHSKSGSARPMPKLIESLVDFLGEQEQDLRLDLWRVREEAKFGDGEVAVDLALSVVDRAGQEGQLDIRFKALLSLHSILRILDRENEARKVLTSIEQLAQRLGPRARADSMRRRGSHLNLLGHEEEARVEIEKALQIYAELGSNSGGCTATAPMGTMKTLEATQQISIFENSHKLCVRGGFQRAEASALQDLGRFWRNIGDFHRSVSLFRESAEILQKLGDKHGIAHNRVSLAVLLSHMGRIEEALENLDIAEAWFRENDAKKSLLFISMVSAEVAMTSGRLSEARRWIDQATALEPSGRRLLELYLLKMIYAYESWDSEDFARASLALKEHARLMGIEKMEKVATGFEARRLSAAGRHQESLELVAGSGPASDFGGTLALGHFELGEIDEARRLAREHAEWTLGIKQQAMIWYAEIVSARIEAAAGSNVALMRLEKIEDEARESGNYTMALEAALARGRAMKSSEVLRAVQQQADAYGLGRLAFQAEQAGQELAS